MRLQPAQTPVAELSADGAAWCTWVIEIRQFRQIRVVNSSVWAWPSSKVRPDP
jgi:hypothetical protein